MPIKDPELYLARAMSDLGAAEVMRLLARIADANGARCGSSAAEVAAHCNWIDCARALRLLGVRLHERDIGGPYVLPEADEVRTDITTDTDINAKRTDIDADLGQTDLAYPADLLPYLRNAYREGYTRYQNGGTMASPFPGDRNDLHKAFARGWHDALTLAYAAKDPDTDIEDDPS